MTIGTYAGTYADHATPIAQQMNLDDAMRLQRRGHRQVRAKNPELVDRYTELAINICLAEGSVTTDRLQVLLPRPEGVSPNIMGSILRRPLFYIDDEAKSERKLARGRTIRVWRLNTIEARSMAPTL